MDERVKRLEAKVAILEEAVENLAQLVKQISDTTYKTSDREIINRDVQFLQKVYDKNGAVVTEINP